MRTKINLTLKTEGRTYLLVTFLERFATQSKMSLIFTETLLFPRKIAF